MPEVVFVGRGGRARRAEGDFSQCLGLFRRVSALFYTRSFFAAARLSGNDGLMVVKVNANGM